MGGMGILEAFGKTVLGAVSTGFGVVLAFVLVAPHAASLRSASPGFFSLALGFTMQLGSQVIMYCGGASFVTLSFTLTSGLFSVRHVGWVFRAILVLAIAILGHLVGGLLIARLAVESNLLPTAAADFARQVAVSKVEMLPSVLLARAILCNLALGSLAFVNLTSGFHKGALAGLTLLVATLARTLGLDSYITCSVLVPLGWLYGAVLPVEGMLQVFLVSALGNVIGGFLMSTLLWLASGPPSISSPTETAPKDVAPPETVTGTSKDEKKKQ